MTSTIKRLSYSLRWTNCHAIAGAVMTNTEILTKAIQKAVESGWMLQGVYSAGSSKSATKYIVDGFEPKLFIFDHDFAKALWGDQRDIDSPMSVGPRGVVSIHNLRPWQYHLQQMVIAEDPIKYLGEHLNEQ